MAYPTASLKDSMKYITGTQIDVDILKWDRILKLFKTYFAYQISLLSKNYLSLNKMKYQITQVSHYRD